MEKTDPIGIRLEPAEREALERAAAADDRTMSAFARRVLVEWLRKGGWLKKERAVARKPKEGTDA